MVGNIKKAIKAFSSKISGVNLVQEEIDTLYYFLDSYVDIKNIPPAKGDLRNLQVCDAAMLRIFDILCLNYNLEYWLDFGTLLGAARHKGFIPWDDDLDVSMERKQWNRAVEILPPILEDLGFYFRVYSESWFGFGYKRDQTGLWMDVFCYETYKESEDSDLSDLHQLIDEELTFAHANRTFNVQPKISREKMKKNRLASAYSELSSREGKAYLFLSPEMEDRLSHKVFNYDDIYPLSRLDYEGNRMPVPKNWSKVLNEYYGDWLKFPRSGILHHGIKGTSLKDLATLNEINMSDVKDALDQISDDLASHAGA